LGRRLRRLEGRFRAVVWRLLRGVEVGHGAIVGRGCRLIRDPGARVVLGERSELDDGTTIAAYGVGSVILGDRAFVGHHGTIAARERIEIGSGAFLAELVSVRDHDHRVGAPPSSGKVDVEAVTIGPDAWIGAKATLVRGCRVGAGAVVGANAVVRGELPARSVAVGVPARVVRTLPEHDA
jgi:acetyltransferase-like isoleucine patch superfamily enzyme